MKMKMKSIILMKIMKNKVNYLVYRKLFNFK